MGPRYISYTHSLRPFSRVYIKQKRMSSAERMMDRHTYICVCV
jgi:hypothetical protein